MSNMTGGEVDNLRLLKQAHSAIDFAICDLKLRAQLAGMPGVLAISNSAYIRLQRAREDLLIEIINQEGSDHKRIP